MMCFMTMYLLQSSLAVMCKIGTLLDRDGTFMKVFITMAVPAISHSMVSHKLQKQYPREFLVLPWNCDK